jgi:acetate kinase
VKILVVNCGSSSVKYQLFSMPGTEVLARGLVQRIGDPDAALEQRAGGSTVRMAEPVADHRVALFKVVELLTRGEHAPLSDVSEIGAVGHRVVHGGEHFTETVLIDNQVVAAIEAHVTLAPLHNPPNLLGIRAARELLPGVPQVAVFDTAFHQTMPRHAYLYALPRQLYHEGRIRRYGFHGTSHRYVTGRAAVCLNKPVSQVNLITCHLGNGVSIAAVEHGRSVDTSMGLTPLEGLVMGTRSGDIDPAVIFHLARVQQMSVDQIDRLLNKQSGLLGVSGRSNDVRELLRLMGEGDDDAALALELFCYRIKKYIGAYWAALGRLDAVVFTAGIGENAPLVRARSCAGLEPLGISVDPVKNQATIGKEADVGCDGSPIRLLVIPTDEERLIALDTYSLTQQ